MVLRHRKYIWNTWKVKVKVKQSHYSPGQVQRVPEVWGCQISRQSARKGGKVVSPTHRPPLPTRKYSWYSFLLEDKATPGHGAAGRIMSMKNPVTQLGIEPETFRFVAQCLNRLRHPTPILKIVFTNVGQINTILYFENWCVSAEIIGIGYIQLARICS